MAKKGFGGHLYDLTLHSDTPVNTIAVAIALWALVMTAGYIRPVFIFGVALGVAALFALRGVWVVGKAAYRAWMAK